MKTILITGGSGMVGQYLTTMLKENGYQVSWLTRKINPKIDIPQFIWNWEEKYIDQEAIKQASAIIHLSGASVAGKRWTSSWKKEIYDSRIKATELLIDAISKHPEHINTFISASATGYYGNTTSETINIETDPPAHDFLAQTCNDWEKAANSCSNLGIRTAIVRIGIVFSEQSLAYKKISLPIKYGFGSSIGNGNHYFPWIHLEDLCQIFIKIITDNNLKGTYNAVAPEYITYNNVIKSIAKHYKKPLLLPNIPAFVIKILFGEMANTLLNGNRISSEKIIKTGFKFKYSNLNQIFKT